MSYALLSESTPVARKPHRCIWCGEAVATGERYRRERSVYDGNMQDHAWHLECDEDARGYFATDGSEFTPGDAERPARRLGFEPRRSGEGSPPHIAPPGEPRNKAETRVRAREGDTEDL